MSESQCCPQAVPLNFAIAVLVQYDVSAQMRCGVMTDLRTDVATEGYSAVHGYSLRLPGFFHIMGVFSMATVCFLLIYWPFQG